MITDIGSLSDLTNIGTLFAFVLVCIGVIILRRKDPGRPRPFRVPMVPWFPIVGVILVLAFYPQFGLKRSEPSVKASIAPAAVLGAR